MVRRAVQRYKRETRRDEIMRRGACGSAYLVTSKRGNHRPLPTRILELDQSSTYLALSSLSTGHSHCCVALWSLAFGWNGLLRVSPLFPVTNCFIFIHHTDIRVRCRSRGEAVLSKPPLRRHCHHPVVAVSILQAISSSQFKVKNSRHPGTRNT